MARLGFCTDLCDKLGILHTQSSPKAGQLHGRFHVRFQQEQNLWNECARLIANAVVHYNSVILSEVLQTLEKASSKAASQALKRISPLAWQRVNFYGRYRFDNDLMSIIMAELTAQLVGSMPSYGKTVHENSASLLHLFGGLGENNQLASLRCH